MTTLERFETKYSPEPNSGCWLWFASRDGNGYGQIHHNGKSVKAYKLAYELLRGQVPEGLELDHLCHVRCCVNPWHLEAVSHRENVHRSPAAMMMLRLKGGGAYQKAKTHCPSGHPYSPENTLVYSSNKARRCRTCHRLQSARRRQQLNLEVA